MLNVRVFSDLHLEFDTPGDVFDPGTGDVLVLAGDICVANDYNDDYHNFFEKCVAGYNQVFYVLGNHEHYGGVFEDTLFTLQDKLPEGICILNNKSMLYRGVHFIGATLWTNQNNLDFDTMSQSQSCMNDYYSVRKRDNRTLTVIDTVEEHLFNRGWFEQCLPTLRGDVFVITHHAPSKRSVKGRYVNNEGAYASDLVQLLEKNPNITHWVHGHIHESSDYTIGNARIVTNPRGYNGQELNPNFDPTLDIQVGT